MGLWNIRIICPNPRAAQLFGGTQSLLLFGGFSLTFVIPQDSFLESRDTGQRSASEAAGHRVQFQHALGFDVMLWMHPLPGVRKAWGVSGD